MILRALLAVCLVWVAMSPAALSAFSQITGAEVRAGIMDLRDDDAYIYAVGVKDGMTWGITCRWVCGRPEWIEFSNPKPEI